MRSPTPKIANPKIAYSVAQAVEATGLGRRAFYEEIRSGRLVAKKVGRRTIVSAKAIEAWLERMPDLQLGAKPSEAA